MIREIKEDDLTALLELYTQLHNNAMPEMDNNLLRVWHDILTDKNHHIIVAEINNKIISSCVLVIVPNLTQKQRSYAIIENVITDKDFRNNGYATKVLDYAKKIAIENDCYKIMLMTGSKDESTLNFYRRAGYNSEDKTAFIQWI